MKFSNFLFPESRDPERDGQVIDETLREARLTDELGFEVIWLAEHHFSTYGYLPRPLQLATFIAARTTRLRVGTAVIVVPLHHPLIIAEEIATLDLLAGGRVDIGLGRGYQPYEFERLGLDLEDARTRWEESVDIILKALSGEPFRPAVGDAAQPAARLGADAARGDAALGLPLLVLPPDLLTARPAAAR